MDIQYELVHVAWRIDMQHVLGQAVWKFNMVMNTQHGKGLQHGHGYATLEWTWTCSMAWHCTMDMELQHGHGNAACTWIWKGSMDNM
jgi:hypothetical protein